MSGMSETPPKPETKETAMSDSMRRVHAIRRAAIRFARDYGPLSGALRGDEDAEHEVAVRLFKACAENGLKIIINPDIEGD